jgi:hypothetical protein
MGEVTLNSPSVLSSRIDIERDIEFRRGMRQRALIRVTF